MANYKGNITLQEIKEKILKAQNIVLTTHINPDGDALGSVLALLLILNEYNKHYIEKIYKRHKFNDAKTMERYNEIFNIAVEYVKSKIEKRIFKNTQEKN